MDLDAGDVVGMVLELGLVVKEMDTFPLRLGGWLVVVGELGVLFLACMSFMASFGIYVLSHILCHIYVSLCGSLICNTQRIVRMTNTIE